VGHSTNGGASTGASVAAGPGRVRTGRRGDEFPAMHRSGVLAPVHVRPSVGGATLSVAGCVDGHCGLFPSAAVSAGVPAQVW
jgi:hypothetical protein